jgi:putative colanic acid biosynthesis glycosyltransferase
MPLFSLITVTRDNLAGLKATHESITIQSAKDFEWIVIDGDSKDGTKEYLKTTPAKWVSEADDGIYDAMNKGIAKSRSDYLLFLNAGDALADAGTLEKIAAKIKEKSPDFIYGDAIEGPHPKPANPHTQIEWGMFTHHQAMFYGRKALAGMSYDTNYEIAADYDLTLRFLRQNVKSAYCKFPICKFAIGGVSQKKALQGRLEQFVIRNRFGISPPKNTTIFIYQSLSWALRRIAPGLFWKMKSAPRSSGNKRPD